LADSCCSRFNLSRDCPNGFNQRDSTSDSAARIAETSYAVAVDIVLTDAPFAGNW
jgi:hypothetical protein